MKYFLDTEFLEGPQRSTTNRKILLLFSAIFLTRAIFFFAEGFNSYGFQLIAYTSILILIAVAVKDKTKNTIDLISIGIVSEDGRHYYAISKDFNIKEAWNRHQQRTGQGDYNNMSPRHYWIRENVLKPIFDELAIKEYNDYNHKVSHIELRDFSYKNLKYLISIYGKSNEEIANGIKRFVNYTGWEVDPPVHALKLKEKGDIEFYAYYADYDWVVFCWLFGKMIDLPEGFPMYCKDLKQMMDEKAKTSYAHLRYSVKGLAGKEFSLARKLDIMKNCDNYPKQGNQHNALDDAKWNKKLYEFIQKL